MANQCINQLILVGDRGSIFDLILGEDINYKKNEIHEINKTTFCVVFSSDWEPPTEKLKEISIKFPKIQMELLYVEKLLKKLGKICIENGDITRETSVMDIDIHDMTKPIDPGVFDDL